MKNIYFKLILIAILFTPCLSVKAQHKNNEIELIKQVLLNQQLAWNEGNITKYMEGYIKSDSLEFIGKKGITYGWQNTLNNYLKSYPDTASMGKLDFTIIKIDVLNKTNAYIVGKWLLIRNQDKGNIGGHFTLLFKKLNEKWLIVSDHSS
jgi:ketosteroid isomerase-like protein